MNTTTSPETYALAAAERPAQFDLSPKTFEQALTFAQYLSESDMVPKDFKGKPGNCLIGMQWGMELGLKPLQAIQNIAVINGRPSLWGDAMLALVRSSPLCEYVVEDWQPDGTAFCRAKRRGEPEQVRTFSDEDARLAGLLGKQGPWTTGPKRMKQMRARAFALRDVFTDVLRGMPMAEEVMDTPPEKFMGDAQVLGKASPVAYWTDEKFSASLPAWREAIAAGKAGKGGAENIIAKAESKGPLSQAQKDAIRAPVAKSDNATDAPVKVTYAALADMLVQAENIDALDDAAALIATLPADQQGDANRLYETRKGELA